MGSAIPGQVGLVCIRKVAEQARESEAASSTLQNLNRRREGRPGASEKGPGQRNVDGASIQSRAVDGMRGVLLDTLTLGQCTFKTDLLGAQHHPSKLLVVQSMCGMLNAVLAPKETD